MVGQWWLYRVLQILWLTNNDDYGWQQSEIAEIQRISATILILSFTSAPRIQTPWTHMSILPSETLCLTVVTARGMGRNKMAAVGSDWIKNNIDNCTGRNWKNSLELWQTLLRLARSGSSGWELGDSQSYCAGVLILGTWWYVDKCRQRYVSSNIILWQTLTPIVGQSSPVTYNHADLLRLPWWNTIFGKGVEVWKLKYWMYGAEAQQSIRKVAMICQISAIFDSCQLYLFTCHWSSTATVTRLAWYEILKGMT